MSFLVGENMVCGYGGADILHGCTVGVDPGEIAVVVGPNGAGMSTAMKELSDPEAASRIANVIEG